MVIRSRDGERVVPAEDYFVGPGIDITRMTVLAAGRAADVHPAARQRGPARTSTSRRSRDRNVWDFALVNVASAMVMSGDTIERMRIAVNGVAATPLRLPAVENAVRGKQRNEATAVVAGDLAIEGAVPLHYNAYKVPLMRNLVRRAIRGTENTWTS